MIIKDRETIAKYREAGRLSLEVMAAVRDALQLGVTTMALDKIAAEKMKELGVEPSFAKVKGPSDEYGFSSCIGVNDVALHGRPNGYEVNDGDIVKIDLGIVYEGFNTDHCFTFIVGNADKEATRLVNTAKLAVDKAVSKVKAGATTGDLGSTMYNISKMAGFDVLKNYVGHGIGTTLHEPPEIAAYGIPNKGAVLKEGMVICVEAQVVEGDDEVYIADNEWDILTEDGGRVAMFEYVVLVKKSGYEILTNNQNWEINVKG